MGFETQNPEVKSVMRYRLSQLSATIKECPIKESEKGGAKRAEEQEI